ncbi:MAG: hypothetical protein RLZZ09_947 [Pseudomonadota bacterium]
MNKAELIAAIAENADLSKADAGKALDGFTTAVTDALARGEDVGQVGFGLHPEEAGSQKREGPGNRRRD